MEGLVEIISPILEFRRVKSKCFLQVYIFSTSVTIKVYFFVNTSRMKYDLTSLHSLANLRKNVVQYKASFRLGFSVLLFCLFVVVQGCYYKAKGHIVTVPTSLPTRNSTEVSAVARVSRTKHGEWYLNKRLGLQTAKCILRVTPARNFVYPVTKTQKLRG